MVSFISLCIVRVYFIIMVELVQNINVI